MIHCTVLNGGCLMGTLHPSLHDEYAAFHHKTKGTAEARYLVYHCVGATGSDKCGGFGDRVRGMLFLFRVAIATRRILLLSSPATGAVFPNGTLLDLSNVVCTSVAHARQCPHIEYK